MKKRAKTSSRKGLHKAARAAERIRVLLVEPRSIRSLLKKLAHVDVVAEADDHQDVLKLIGSRRPQVVFSSGGVAGTDGLRLANQIIKKFPRVRVAMAAPRYSDEYVGHVLRAGVSGLLLQDAPLNELNLALKTLANGGIYISTAASAPGAASRPKRHAATARQREVLELIAEGKNTKEIAALMKISVKTVESHRTKLMKQLKIYNVAGLVRYAIRTGLAAMDLE